MKKKLLEVKELGLQGYRENINNFWQNVLQKKSGV